MVFLDFLDFLEFLETSEVAGPGPNPREIDISFGAQWPLACVRGAVVLALLLLARLHVFPVDLALLNGAHVGLTEPLTGLIFVAAALY